MDLVNASKNATEMTKFERTATAIFLAIVNEPEYKDPEGPLDPVYDALDHAYNLFEGVEKWTNSDEIEAD